MHGADSHGYRASGAGGVPGIAVVFAAVFSLWVLLGVLMKKFLRGEPPEILLEIPPYRFPYWKALGKKMYIRMRGFIKEALPCVLLGVFLVNILYTMGIMDYISRVVGPVITRLFGLPGKVVGALLVGFLRKDVAVGMLAPLGLNLRQLIVASVVLIIYFPCAATFVVLFKELGMKDLLKSTAIMIAASLSVGSSLNFVLGFFGV